MLYFRIFWEQTRQQTSGEISTMLWLHPASPLWKTSFEPALVCEEWQVGAAMATEPKQCHIKLLTEALQACERMHAHKQCRHNHMDLTWILRLSPIPLCHFESCKSNCSLSNSGFNHNCRPVPPPSSPSCSSSAGGEDEHSLHNNLPLIMIKMTPLESWAL